MNKRKLRRLLVLVMAAVMSFSMTACSSDTGSKQDQTTAGNSSSGTTEDNGGEFSKHITFSAGSFELNTVDENGEPESIYQKMKDKFNVDITPVTINWDTWAEQINTMAASNDLPDMARFDFTPDNYGTFLNMVNQGAIRPIPSLENYPNLQKVLATLPISEVMTVDGKLYGWPVARQDNPYNNYTSRGIIYRRDWAKKVGLYKEGDEYTLDEFVALCKAFRDQDPGGNGAGKTIPYAEVGWGFGYLFQAFNPYNVYTLQDGKYIWSLTLPGAVDGLKFYNDLYKEKLYYQDFYAAQDYDARSLYYANMVGIYMDNLSLAGLDGDIIKPFALANPGVNVDDATAIMYLKGNDGKYFTSEMENTWSTTIFSSSVDDETMQRILAMMDYAATKEGMYDYYFGVEGVDWKKNGDEVEVLWPKDEDGNYVQPKFNFSQFRDMTVLAGDFGFANPGISDTAKAAVDAFQQKFDENNSNIVKLDYPCDYLSTSSKDKYGTFGLDTSAEQKRIVASSKDVEGDFKAWVDSMMPKVQPVLDEINAELAP